MDNHCHCGQKIRKNAKLCAFHAAQNDIGIKDARIVAKSHATSTTKATARRQETALAARAVFLKRQKLQKLKVKQP